MVAVVADVEVTRDGAVLTITLNRPDVLNALNSAVHDGHPRRASSEAKRPGGARRRDHRRRAAASASARTCRSSRAAPDDVADNLRENYHRNVLAIRALEKPVIAAVNGPAAGAGHVARARVRRAHRRATRRASCPAFVKIGLVPDSGGTWLVAPAARHGARVRVAHDRPPARRRRGARSGASSPRSSRPTSSPSARSEVAAALRGDADARGLGDEAPARRGRDVDASSEQLELEAIDAGGADADARLPRGRRGVPREARAGVHRRATSSAAIRSSSSSTTTCGAGG